MRTILANDITQAVREACIEGCCVLPAPVVQALERAKAEAVELAVAAGAVRESVEIIDVEDVPLQYYPGNTCRVKIKAAGDLA